MCCCKSLSFAGRPVTQIVCTQVSAFEQAQVLISARVRWHRLPHQHYLLRVIVSLTDFGHEYDFDRQETPYPVACTSALTHASSSGLSPSDSNRGGTDARLLRSTCSRAANSCAPSGPPLLMSVSASESFTGPHRSWTRQYAGTRAKPCTAHGSRRACVLSDLQLLPQGRIKTEMVMSMPAVCARFCAALTAANLMAGQSSPGRRNCAWRPSHACMQPQRDHDFVNELSRHSCNLHTAHTGNVTRCVTSRHCRYIAMVASTAIRDRSYQKNKNALQGRPGARAAADGCCGAAG